MLDQSCHRYNSRMSFFQNKWRESGIKEHKSLLHNDLIGACSEQQHNQQPFGQHDN